MITVIQMLINSYIYTVLRYNYRVAIEWKVCGQIIYIYIMRKGLEEIHGIDGRLSAQNYLETLAVNNR